MNKTLYLCWRLFLLVAVGFPFLAATRVAGLEPAPIMAPNPPDPRPRGEIEAMLEAVPPPANSEALSPLHVVLCAAEKDRAHMRPGVHDYPLWRERWTRLLSLAPGVTTEPADRWPTRDQWARADVVISFHNNPAWNAARGPDIDAFLARGGGLVFLHYAIRAGNADRAALAQRLGHAWGEAGNVFRIGPTPLQFKPHAITAGFPLDRTVSFIDETYSRMIGDLGGWTVLATSAEPSGDEPQVWLREAGRGRVFVCIPGHSTWTFDDPIYRLLVFRGLLWTARQPLGRLNELVTVGARVALEPSDSTRLEAAFSRLRTSDWNRPAEDLIAIDEAIATAAPGTPARRELESRLAEILGSHASVAARQFACARLAVIGTRLVVPSLGPLLAHPEVSHAARLALEGIPGDEALAALRNGLPRAERTQKIGIIHSLGERGDPAAVGVLQPLLDGEDFGLASAAAMAMGQIGTRRAAEALEEVGKSAGPDLKSVVAQSRLVAAEHLMRGEERAVARRIFREICSADSDRPLRVAAWQGRLRTESDQATELIQAALAGSDDALRDAAEQELLKWPASESIAPFLRRFGTLPPAGQIAVLDIAAARAEPAGREAALGACASPEPRVRDAAFRALGATGTADDALSLARLAAGTGNDSSAARLALANLPDAKVDRRLIEALDTATASLRIELLAALSARAAYEAAPSVIPFLQSNAPETTAAALTALGALGNEEHLPAVLATLGSASDGTVQRAAEKALGTIVLRTRPRCTGVLLSELRNDGDAVRVSILRLLPALGGADALAAVRRGHAHPDAAVRAAAFRALAGWPDDSALPDLLEIAQDESSGDRLDALRSYLRIVTRDPGANPDTQFSRLEKVTPLVRTADETAMLISSYGQITAPASLQRLAVYLEDPAQADAAGAAIVRIAATLGPSSADLSLPLLRQVAAISREPAVRQRALDLLAGAKANP